MNWEVHPLADLIPSMTDEEYISLRDDIAAHGQRNPITLYDGKILDGRHRVRACRELGIEPSATPYSGPEPAALVLSLNIKRRSLNPSQRAAVVLDFLPQLEAEARKRQAATQLAGRKPGGEPIGPAPRTRTETSHRAREEAGALVNVSGATVDRAKRVQREAPEEFARVKAGETTLRAADNALRSRKRPRVNQNGCAPQEITTDRQRQLAGAQRRRIEEVVGTCQAFANGLADLKVELATGVATPDEIAGWTKCLKAGERALRDARRRLEGVPA